MMIMIKNSAFYKALAYASSDKHTTHVLNGLVFIKSCRKSYIAIPVLFLVLYTRYTCLTSSIVGLACLKSRFMSHHYTCLTSSILAVLGRV
jgi:hypothetical protein